VGDGFGCAIRGDVRELRCWGGAVTPPMLGPTERLLSLRALAVGARHACVAAPRAATDDNVIRCFGDNDRAQLGGPVNAMNIASVQTADGELFTMRSLAGLAAGASHSCAFDAQGVWCWGANEQGQLGRPPLPGSAAVAAAPVQFASSVQVIDVAAGGESTCAVVSDARVTSDAGTDASAGNDSGIEAGAPSDAACAAPSTGTLHATVLCWGAISRADRCAPAPIAVRRADGGTLDDVARVYVGSTHACAITNDAEVFCWGQGGESRFTDVAAPGEMTATRIAALRGARELSITGAANVLPTSARSAGRESFCALLGAGATSAVKCWGPNDNAQLGDSARGVSVVSTPLDVRW
jgi:alpha-tubulin suppressor-like RCC1 family protein